MAGGRLEASAEFGPAWAHITFGADGIVYFDPFRFEVRHLRPHLGRRHDRRLDRRDHDLDLDRRQAAPRRPEVPRQGDLFDRARRRHGSIRRPPAEPEGVPGLAGLRAQVPRGRRHRPAPARSPRITGRGTLAPGAGGGTPDGTADGSAAKPFVVYSEFELLVTTTVPTATFVAGSQSVRTAAR